MANPEILITIEGPSGSGKSTLLQHIAEILGSDYELNVVVATDSQTVLESDFKDSESLYNAVTELALKGTKIVITDKQTPRVNGVI